MASSSDPSQVSSGISLPQWMTSKISDPRFDSDSAAFSPPSHDDSFFYIRYPIGGASRAKGSADTNQNWDGDKGFRSLSDVLRGDKKAPQVAPSLDYSKHTKPCQQFINGVPSPSPVTDKPKDRPQKSNGTDDGFKGKGAACGTSIVKVAKQMIASGGNANANANANGSAGKSPLNRSGTADTLELKRETELEPTSGVGYDYSRRRGSKSLPASPLGSPKTQRRSPNPYFTGTFFMQPVSNNTEHSPRGWILASLLGSRSDVRNLNDSIEEAHEALDDVTLSASIDDLGLHDKKSPGLKAKPSELREMNFWSPTSM